MAASRIVVQSVSQWIGWVSIRSHSVMSQVSIQLIVLVGLGPRSKQGWQDFERLISLNFIHLGFKPLNHQLILVGARDRRSCAMSWRSCCGRDHELAHRLDAHFLPQTQTSEIWNVLMLTKKSAFRKQMVFSRQHPVCISCWESRWFRSPRMEHYVFRWFRLQAPNEAGSASRTTDTSALISPKEPNKNLEFIALKWRLD